MAAREHQGMQVALIIFVILTISLGVTSYWCFDQFQNEQQKRQSETRHAQKAESDQKLAVEDLNKLKRMMGFGTRDDLGPIEMSFQQDMEGYANTFPEASRNYPFVLKELDKQLKKKSEQLVDSSVRLKQFEDKIQQDAKDKTVEIAEYKQHNDRTTQDAVNERDTFNGHRNAKNKTEADLLGKLASERNEHDLRASKCATELKDLRDRLAQLMRRLQDLVAKIKDFDISSELADGTIMRANQRGHVVWLNLGTDDGLRRQISFTVIGADENNPLKAEKKGSVEVTRILDRHLSEARIIDDSPSNPILPGDKVFSIAWQPGRAEHFALIGFMDLDQDGVSDRQRIREIIELNGGIVDEEVADDGTKTGEMTIHARYLVRGEPSADKNAAKVDRALIEEARLFPVKTISVPELVEYLGYKAKGQAIPLGANARSADFKPRAPEDVPRKSGHNPFLRHRSTPSGAVKSAY